MKCSWCGGRTTNGLDIHNGCADARSRVEADKVKPKRGREGHRRKIRPVNNFSRSPYYLEALADFKLRMAKRGIKI